MISTEERESLLAKGEQEYDEAVHQLERNDYNLAFKHFELAEQAFLQLHDQHWLTFLYHEKFRIYRLTDQSEQALELTDSIINGYLDTKNKRGLVLIHIHKADILGDKEQPIQALACLRTAEAIVNSEKITDLKGYLYSSLAVVFMVLEDYIEAMNALQKALQTYSADSDAIEVAWCLHQLGNCYLKLFDLNSAERYFIGAYQSYFQAGDNEAGRGVIEQLKEMYQTSNQVNKIAQLDTIGKQKRF